MKRLSPEGFSLLELLVVLTIVSLFAMVVMPVVFSSSGNTESLEIQKIATTIRYIRDSAIQYKKTFRMSINLDKNTILYNTPDGERTLSSTSLTGVFIPQKGTIMQGEITIYFTAEGLNSFLGLFFSSGQCITYNPFSGLVRIHQEDACRLTFNSTS